MGCVRGLFRCLFGQEEDEPRSKYYSDCQSFVQRAPLLSGHNAPTRFESSWTTPSTTTTITSPFLRSQSNTQTTSIKQEKSTAGVQKSKVLSPSTLKQDSSAPKPLSFSEANPFFPYEFSRKATSPTSSSSLRSQSNTQTTSTKPEKSNVPITMPKVLSPSTTSTKTNKLSEIVQKPKVLSSSTLQSESSSPKPRQYSSKPTLSPAPVNSAMDQKKTNYVWVNKGTTAYTYKVPEDVEALIKKDILPNALKKPLSPSTYKNFFHTMLYAEDLYIEKWSGFEMENVTLEVEDATIYKRKGKDKNFNKANLVEEDDKVFVAFEMDSVPQNRPFLLSRDFAFVRPSGSSGKPFQGIIYRVVRSNRVLVEFGKDFHSHHYKGSKYDVKFSFNRICLKRAHLAIDSVSDSLFKNYLFPTSDCSSRVIMLTSQSSYTDGKLDTKQIAAVHRICRHHGPPPCLIEGPLCIIDTKLSRTGILIREAIIRTYRANSDARILICAPSNVTCDELVKSLGKEIPESSMFRANAAFRERDEVVPDIISSCRISGDCFSCPLLEELKKFKVVSSTYMSCFRLHNEGLDAGHFSQMFMLDASSTTEPEALVALAHFAHESTGVVVTGARGNSSRWVRSHLARRSGLTKSYFERLYESKSYEDVCHL